MKYVKNVHTLVLVAKLTVLLTVLLTVFLSCSVVSSGPKALYVQNGNAKVTLTFGGSGAGEVKDYLYSASPGLQWTITNGSGKWAQLDLFSTDNQFASTNWQNAVVNISRNGTGFNLTCLLSKYPSASIGNFAWTDTSGSVPDTLTSNTLVSYTKDFGSTGILIAPDANASIYEKALCLKKVEITAYTK